MERVQPPELTEEQAQLADVLIEQCELQDVADQPFAMMGEVGTVRYGLGRCAEHLADMDFGIIAAIVREGLAQSTVNNQ